MMIVKADPGFFAASSLDDYDDHRPIPGYAQKPVIAWAISISPDDGSKVYPVTVAGIWVHGHPHLIIDPRGVIWHGQHAVVPA